MTTGWHIAHIPAEILEKRALSVACLATEKVQTGFEPTTFGYQSDALTLRLLLSNLLHHAIGCYCVYYVVQLAYSQFLLNKHGCILSYVVSFIVQFRKKFAFQIHLYDNIQSTSVFTVNFDIFNIPGPFGVYNGFSYYKIFVKVQNINIS